MARTAIIDRVTSESNVHVEIDLDGTGASTISTGVGFYDHMLTALARHSGIDMTITTTGDVHIDGHHSVEDTAIALGQALAQALGDKRGITRFGDAIVPLDEALAQCVVDVAGRPYVVCSGEPDAQIYALDEHGIHRRAYKETDQFRVTRAFLESPGVALEELLKE